MRGCYKSLCKLNSEVLAAVLESIFEADSNYHELYYENFSNEAALLESIEDSIHQVKHESFIPQYEEGIRFFRCLNITLICYIATCSDKRVVLKKILEIYDACSPIGDECCGMDDDALWVDTFELSLSAMFVEIANDISDKDWLLTKFLDSFLKSDFLRGSDVLENLHQFFGHREISIILEKCEDYVRNPPWKAAGKRLSSFLPLIEEQLGGLKKNTDNIS